MVAPINKITTWLLWKPGRLIICKKKNKPKKREESGTLM